MKAIILIINKLLFFLVNKSKLLIILNEDSTNNQYLFSMYACFWKRSEFVRLNGIFKKRDRKIGIS